MKILGIESSSMTASAAYLQDDLTVAEYTINFKLTHSQTLLPMIDELARRVELDPATLDTIAVSAGPGSFTGLRIGAATAKGLGLALDKPLISVPTLDALAFNLYHARGLICPMLDARRGQVYAGVYSYSEDLIRVKDTECLLLDDLITWLNGRGEEVVFLGDGAAKGAAVLEEKLMVPYTFAPPNLCNPRASSVAALGAQYFNKGKILNAAEFVPDYLRKVEAEQVLEEAKIEGRAEELKAGHILKQEDKNDSKNASGRSGGRG